jgi:type II secretory pathway predicted ATPase ExeA
MLEKIQSYFGFTTLPFGRALAPGKLFHSGDHAQAVARIGYGIATRGITVITGEVGVGKTVAARAAIDRAEPARHHPIYIPDPTVGARGIYHHIVTALGGRPSFHNAALVPQARDALAAEHAERGRACILCIDEGHLLGHDALEALRLLTNHRLDTDSPFATILLGQPTLAAKMALGTLAALEQRITVRRAMTGMSSEETGDYIAHNAARTVMRRHDRAGLVSGGALPRTFRIIETVRCDDPRLPRWPGRKEDHHGWIGYFRRGWPVGRSCRELPRDAGRAGLLRAIGPKAYRIASSPGDLAGGAGAVAV